MRTEVCFHCVLVGLTFVAVKCLECFGKHSVGIGTDDFFRVRRRQVQFDVSLGLADLFADVFDESALFLDGFVTEHDCVQHFLFGNLVCACFHHHDCVLGTCKVQVQAATFLLFLRGVDDVLAVNVTHNHATRRSCKGNVGDAERNAAAHHSVHFRLDVGFHGHSRSDD